MAGIIHTDGIAITTSMRTTAGITSTGTMDGTTITVIITGTMAGVTIMDVRQDSTMVGMVTTMVGAIIIETIPTMMDQSMDREVEGLLVALRLDCVTHQDLQALEALRQLRLI